MRNTEPDSESLNFLWARMIESPDESDAMKVLDQLVPIVQSLLRHVDELQGEIELLKRDQATN